MERAVYIIVAIWLLMLGVIGTDSATWNRYAIEVPGFEKQTGFKMIGGATW